ncbi:MAG TPA: hypothetical protein VFO55_00650 [Gemmatimonadaceae bacterium]|nr:hypothetical protein [Gemmatimonadaceae bacterium]
MTPTRLLTGTVALSLAATSVARAQCPNGTPPPCDTRQTASMQLIRRAAPVLDDRTYIVLPFHNVTRAPDAEWLGDAAVSMLSMDLARWEDIKVVDDRRVADFMRDVRVAPGTKLSMNDALGVARRAGAGRVVVGDVMKVGSRTTVTATLFNVRDGRQIRSAREETTVADSIIPLFGRLARRILAVPSANANFGSVGTSRVDAYKEYVAGNQALNKFDAPTAKKHYEAALARDSTFALAHYKWAIAATYDQNAAAERQAQVRLSDLNSMARVLEDRERIDHAKAAARLAGPSLPARERALIAGLLATVTYDYPRACESYGSLVRADSSDIDALYGYGLCLLSDDMVEPVVPGDTSRMRFRTSWNESLDVFRRAVSVDPTFHLAFDAIVSILTAPVRTGCARQDLLATCADTAIRRRYVASIRRSGDSLLTVPRPGFATVVDLIRESNRSTPPRANIELASRAAADWIVLGPSEGRAHKHLANLLLRLGRAAEAGSEIEEALKDPAMRADPELYLRRLEVAFKLMQGDVVNRLVDSMPAAIPTELGRANAATYAVATGRLRAADSLFDVLLAQQPGFPAALRRVMKQGNRVVIGVSLDSLVAIERDFFGVPRVPATCGMTPCFRLLGVNYTLGLRVPRTWPPFSDELASDATLAPAIAIARNDTAALRSAAVVLDSLSRAGLVEGRPEDGSSPVAAEAYLALGDSAAALRIVRRMTDSTLQQSGIESGSAGMSIPIVLLWPRALLLRADLEAARGDKAVAREHYTRFLTLWAKADPEAAPIVSRVRAALGQLR